MSAGTSPILRRIWPSLVRCLECRQRCLPAGSSRSGGTRYYRCPACGATQQVVPIAIERDHGGAWSQIDPVR